MVPQTKRSHWHAGARHGCRFNANNRWVFESGESVESRSGVNAALLTRSAVPQLNRFGLGGFRHG
jgi:hypothetical protein